MIHLFLPAEGTYYILLAFQVRPACRAGQQQAPISLPLDLDRPMHLFQACLIDRISGLFNFYFRQKERTTF
ncbi:MAG: hypothetical protein AAF623_21125, partial [Planctomycetota bacterium]